MLTFRKSRAIRSLSFTACVIGGLISPTLSFADQILLESYDGSTSMSGEFLSYENGTYALGTPLGDMLVPASLVACKGAACPSVAQVVSDLQDAGFMLMTETPEGATGHVFCPVTGELLSQGAGS